MNFSPILTIHERSSYLHHPKNHIIIIIIIMIVVIVIVIIVIIIISIIIITIIYHYCLLITITYYIYIPKAHHRPIDRWNGSFRKLRPIKKLQHAAKVSVAAEAKAPCTKPRRMGKADGINWGCFRSWFFDIWWYLESKSEICSPDSGLLKLQWIQWTSLGPNTPGDSWGH